MDSRILRRPAADSIEKEKTSISPETKFSEPTKITSNGIRMTAFERGQGFRVVFGHGFYTLWSQSHHGLAMQPYTSEFVRANLRPVVSTVLGGVRAIDSFSVMDSPTFGGAVTTKRGFENGRGTRSLYSSHRNDASSSGASKLRLTVVGTARSSTSFY